MNQTISLAYGRGNTLLYCAERIAAELDVEPQMPLAPSLLGEVTHYVADLNKARELLGYRPRDDAFARNRQARRSEMDQAGAAHNVTDPGQESGLRDDLRPPGGVRRARKSPARPRGGSGQD